MDLLRLIIIILIIATKAVDIQQWNIVFCVVVYRCVNKVLNKLKGLREWHCTIIRTTVEKYMGKHIPGGNLVPRPSTRYQVQITHNLVIISWHHPHPSLFINNLIVILINGIHVILDWYPVNSLACHWPWWNKKKYLNGVKIFRDSISKSVAINNH